MTASLLDTLVVGLAIALGLLVAGTVVIGIRRPIATAPWPWRRHVAIALGVVALGEGVLALARLAMFPENSWGIATLTLVLSITALAYASHLWSAAASPSTVRDSTVARRDMSTPTGEYAAIGTFTGESRILPVSSSRLTGLLFEGSADAIGTPLPSDPAEFDARLMHANRMQSIGRLAGGIAHDFNNLLTSILTSAEMAQEALPAEHGVAPDLEEIRRAGTRASELTRQLLAFARRDVSRPRVIDANMLVGNLATMLRRLLGETISLHISLGTELPFLYADPAQIEQVIVNLAVNARDAMPQGGELHLRTLRGFPARRGSTDGSPVGVMLEVQDNGLGMSAEVRERLFEPFFTTKNPGRGTGLGLATCQAIVITHGGEIEVESAPDEGTTFRVWIPATDEDGELRVPGALDANRVASGASQQSILVVEDDADVRASTVRALRRAGYAVIEAADGEEAVSRLAGRGRPVDLVVSDVVMPNMGGAAFLQVMAQRWPDVPVLFISGYPGDSPDVAAVEATGLHVLEKPYTPSILLFEVRLRLEGARST